MRHVHTVRIGPVGFRIGSAWREPIDALRALYRGYPEPHDDVPDFTVRLEPARPWRRWLRPSIALDGDYRLPEAQPLALRHGLLAAEMGMNLQMALGLRRWLLLHASSVERDGRALVMTGESGAGKSTLAALLAARGWRLMGDEFALLGPEDGRLSAFPRAVSLKNDAIEIVASTHAASGMTRPSPSGEGVGVGPIDWGLHPAGRPHPNPSSEGEGLLAPVDPARWGPVMRGTPKGTIRHLRPAADALARMDETASPALILFPRFGHDAAVRSVAPVEAFVRLTQASTNYVALGEAGWAALTRLVRRVPAVAIDYPDTATALHLVERVWADAQ